MIPLALLRPLALLPLLACLPCCGGESPVRDEPPCPGAEPRVSLALTYPPGDYRVEVDQEMAMEMEGGGSGGGPLSGARNRYRQWLDIVSLPPGGEGGIRLELEITRIRQETRSGGREFVADTARPETLAAGELLAGLQHLVGVPFTIHLDEEGQVLAVEGAEALWEKLARQKEPRLARLRRSFDPEALSGILAGMVQMAPGKPVGEGAVWYSVIGLPFLRVGELGMEVKHKLLSIEATPGGRVARISQVGRLAADRIDLSRLQRGTSGEMAMEMDLHGESRVAVGTGLVREVSLEMSGRIRSRVEVEGARRVMRMAIAGKQRVGIEPQ